MSHGVQEPRGSPLFALLWGKTAEAGRGAALRWKPQTKGSTELQDNFLPRGEGVSHLGQRNPKAGFKPCPETPRGAPVSPGTARGSQRGGRTSCAAWGGCGRCWSRQAAALGMWYPESSTSAGCLATSIPQEPPRPHVPASSSAATGSGSGGETRNLHLVSTGFPLPAEAPGPGCAGDVLCCNRSLHPIGPQPPLRPRADRKGGKALGWEVCLIQSPAAASRS